MIREIFCRVRVQKEALGCWWDVGNSVSIKEMAMVSRVMMAGDRLPPSVKLKMTVDGNNEATDKNITRELIFCIQRCKKIRTL